MADHGQPGTAGLEQHGFSNLKRVNWNWTAAELYEQAVRLGEGKVAKDGPLVVLTGQHTGRSPKDKYFVVEPSVGSAHLVGKQPVDGAGAVRDAVRRR